METLVLGLLALLLAIIIFGRDAVMWTFGVLFAFAVLFGIVFYANL